MRPPAGAGGTAAARLGGQTVEPAGGPLLYTPGAAAELLAVPESWLRRKAGRRLIPCTFLGKHLRFSAADLAVIAAGGSQPVLQSRRKRGYR